MTSAYVQSSNKVERVTIYFLLAATALCLVTLARTYSPEALLDALNVPSTILGWAPFAVVVLVWLSGAPWRARAVVWLMVWTSALGAASLLVFAGSGIYHAASWGFVGNFVTVACFLCAGIAILFTWGFFKHRRWALRISLFICKLTIALTILSGFFVGIKAGEVWSLLDSALTWYWLTSPEVEKLFA